MPQREYQFYVYILSSRTRNLYVGMTNDIVLRVAQHREHRPGTYTARYNIDRLVYFERFQYVNDAIAREKKLKDWSRTKKSALIERENPTWLTSQNRGDIPKPSSSTRETELFCPSFRNFDSQSAAPFVCHSAANFCLSFRSKLLFVIPQQTFVCHSAAKRRNLLLLLSVLALFVCHSAANFCLSFRSEAEESAFAVVCSCPFCLSFRSKLLFVIPQQTFVCHSAAKRRNLLLLLSVLALFVCHSAANFCLSFRSEAEESAFAVVCSCPFCLSFRSTAEESAFDLPNLCADETSVMTWIRKIPHG
jgi:putative endonuclease